MAMPSDLEIARATRLRPIDEIARTMGLDPDLLEHYGEHVAKVKLAAIERLADRPPAKYVVVSAITPTPLGEGKTTTTVGLGQAMHHIGRSATIAIRQPSMGPTFGIKGGAAGGGYSQAVPMESFNLHLTGDMHAVTAAHNMLSAMVDNHLYQGNALDLDPHNITWRRVLDVNDRALRNIVVGLGTREDGVPRQTGFDITAASEVMAVLALSTSLADMRARLGRIVVGYTSAGEPVMRISPWFITVTRCEKPSTRSMSCSTISTGMLAATLVTRLETRSRSAAGRPASGSSSSSTCGLQPSAMPRSTRRCPP